MSRSLVLVLLAALLTAALAGCHEPADPNGDTGTDGGDGGAGGSAGSIEIGFIMVLSGPAASLGESGLRGAELAIDEINADGGINGKELKVRVGDTKLDPTEATRVFQEIIDDGEVQAIVGALASGISAAIIPAADEAEVTLVSPASTRVDLTKPRISDHFFRVIPSDVIQGTKAASLLFNDLEVSDTVVMYQNNAYATGLKDIFVEEYEALTGTVQGDPVVFHESDVATYPGPAQDALAMNPTHIWISGQSPEIAHLIKELRAAGYTGAITTSEAIEDSAIFDVAGDDVDGVLFTKPFVDTTTSVYDDFQSAFQDKHGADVGAYSAYAYDAVYVIADALLAGKTTGNDISAHLQSESFTGRVTTPTIAFNQDGDVTVGDYVLWEIAYDATAGGSFSLYGSA